MALLARFMERRRRSPLSVVIAHEWSYEFSPVTVAALIVPPVYRTTAGSFPERFCAGDHFPGVNNLLFASPVRVPPRRRRRLHRMAWWFRPSYIIQLRRLTATSSRGMDFSAGIGCHFFCGWYRAAC